jgi:hypothetical protein
LNAGSKELFALSSPVAGSSRAIAAAREIPRDEINDMPPFCHFGYIFLSKLSILDTFQRRVLFAMCLKSACYEFGVIFAFKTGKKQVGTTDKSGKDR